MTGTGFDLLSETLNAGLFLLACLALTGLWLGAQALWRRLR